MTIARERLGLTPEERRAFDERGLVKLTGAVSRRAAEEMADRLWAELARKDDVQRRSPATWRIERPFHFQALLASGAFKAMGSPRIRAALDGLLGAGRWSEPADWGQPLVCFPNGRAEWELPRKGWHFDGPVDAKPQRRLIGRVFVLLAPLRPRGGGTLVATGSHRLAMAIADAAGAQQSSSEMRQRLQASHGWFRELARGEAEGEKRNARFMASETQVAGVSLRVEEMSGEPGDAFLMHPNTLHSGGPNVLDGPRLALTQFVMPRDG